MPSSTTTPGHDTAAGAGCTTAPMTPAPPCVTERVAARLAHVRDEAAYARERAGWIAAFGGHRDAWAHRADRYERAAARLAAVA